ncbi:hypothetical protein [Paracoccus fontiphilus]|uniref:Secreted protein n=1 Tax=Paracoccus fontiphilus TaxID=1815556 RepID=A0ABV7IHZ6_9RHOB|nr:hypothetical protein [Paracoccus fontiphilus]
MLMHVCVLPAFLRAMLACRGASLDGGPKNLHVRPCATRSHGPRCCADIGTVEVQPDALPELIDHWLGQTGIGAGNAGLGAAVALLDAFQQVLRRVPLNIGVGADHFSNVHDLSPFSW